LAPNRGLGGREGECVMAGGSFLRNGKEKEGNFWLVWVARGRQPARVETLEFGDHGPFTSATPTASIATIEIMATISNRTEDGVMAERRMEREGLKVMFERLGKFKLRAKLEVF
jgi:hypothetical protein